MPWARACWVVDDERIIADTLALILKQHGFEATAVYSGEAAVDAADTLRPDAVVADVIMGGMNGIELAIHITTLDLGCRVILFSGQLETIDLLADAERRGCRFEILTKPVHPEELLNLLNAPQFPSG